MARLRKVEATRDPVGSGPPRTADPIGLRSSEGKLPEARKQWRTGQDAEKALIEEIATTKKGHSSEGVNLGQKDPSLFSESQAIELDDDDVFNLVMDDEAWQPDELSTHDEHEASKEAHIPEGSTTFSTSTPPIQTASPTPKFRSRKDQDDTDDHSDSSNSSDSGSSSNSDGESDGDGNYSDMSDFIVDDSASETELRRGARRPRRTPPVTRSPRRLVRRSPAKRSPILDADSDSDEIRISRSGHDDHDEADIKKTTDTSQQDAHKRTITSLADQLDATLRLSPPSSRPADLNPDDDATPPPESPSRRLLKSPTRNRMNIPTSPHRQSVDAFWSQNTTDGWNDTYSPRKKLDLRDRLRHFHISPGRGQVSRPVLVDSDLEEFKSSEDDEEGFHTPTEVIPPKTPRRRSITRRTGSPEKSPAKTPASPSKARDPAQRAFLETGRQRLAADFLDRLLDTIHVSSTDPSPSRVLFEKCGGVKIAWSKTLQKTAGRARVTRRKGHGRISVEAAEIELAEKVLWTAAQVCNTLAHEFCHLLTMATYPNASAHGREFYHFAHAVERAVPAPAPGVAVKITTKHSYEIQFKYVWQCENCLREIGRHSKSLQERATHKGCGGRFVQIKPVPRKLAAGPNGAADSKSAPVKSTWQAFQQGNYKIVQRQLTTADGKQPTMKEVMSKLSEMWKARKNAQTGSERSVPLDSGTALGDGLDRRTGKDAVQITELVEISDDDEDDDDSSVIGNDHDGVSVDE